MTLIVSWALGMAFATFVVAILLTRQGTSAAPAAPTSLRITLTATMPSMPPQTVTLEDLGYDAQSAHPLGTRYDGLIVATGQIVQPISFIYNGLPVNDGDAAWTIMVNDNKYATYATATEKPSSTIVGDWTTYYGFEIASIVDAA